MTEEQKETLFLKISECLSKEDTTQLASFCFLWSLRELKRGTKEVDYPKLSYLQKRIKWLYNLIAKCFIEDYWKLPLHDYFEASKEIKTLAIFIILGLKKRGYAELEKIDRYQNYFLEELAGSSFSNKVFKSDQSFEPVIFLMNEDLLRQKYNENKMKLTGNKDLDIDVINAKLIVADKARREEKQKNVKSLSSVMTYLKANLIYDIEEIELLYNEFSRICMLLLETKNAFDTTMAVKLCSIRTKLNLEFDEPTLEVMKVLSKIDKSLTEAYDILQLDKQLNGSIYDALDGVLADEIR